MHTSIIATTLFLAATALAEGGYGAGYGGSSGGSGSGSGSGSYGSSGSSGSYGSSGSGSGSGSSMSAWQSWGQAPSAVPPNVAAPSQPASPPAMAPPMAPPMGEQIVQVVSVSDANGSLKYFPNSVQAPVGSIVQFQFHPKNHTVTESTFANPCEPVAKVNASLITTTRPGLKSGFVPVTPMDTETPVYNVLVNDTKPIWVYCGQTNHCQKGMAMVINQNLSSTDKTIENYIANAMMLPLVSTNTTGTPPAGAPPSYGAPPSAQTSVVVVPPPSAATSTAGLPPPAASAASTTTAAGPATFTGAASQQKLNVAAAGLAIVVGAVALL